MRGCQLLFHLSAKNDIESERGGREVELLSLSKIPYFLQDLALTGGHPDSRGKRVRQMIEHSNSYVAG